MLRRRFLQALPVAALPAAFAADGEEGFVSLFDGSTLKGWQVREVIPDDGVTSQAYQQPMGAWDHEAWYYASCNMQGDHPMIRWSAFSAPDRLATIPKRAFSHQIKAGKPGVYRIRVMAPSITT